MQVMLDLYAGRPNPQWTLAPAEAAALVVRARALRDVAALPPALLQAGWRGFVVQGDAPWGAAAPWLRVRDGIVTLQGRALQDSTGIEAMLEAAARRRGYGALLDEARRTASPGGGQSS
jgi:hypothetical protein